MSIAKSIATLSVVAAFAVAAAIAPPAFAVNNSQSGTVTTQDDLEKNGWYCMQSSETSYYWVCTKVFDQTYECHFGFCSPAPIRPAGNRVSRMPNGAATATTPPLTGTARTPSGTQATPRTHQ